MRRVVENDRGMQVAVVGAIVVPALRKVREGRGTRAPKGKKNGEPPVCPHISRPHISPAVLTYGRAHTSAPNCHPEEGALCPTKDRGARHQHWCCRGVHRSFASLRMTARIWRPAQPRGLCPILLTGALPFWHRSRIGAAPPLSSLSLAKRPLLPSPAPLPWSQAMGIASPRLNRAGLVRRLPNNGLRLANVCRGTDRNHVYLDLANRRHVCCATFGSAHIAVVDRCTAWFNHRLSMK